MDRPTLLLSFLLTLHISASGIISTTFTIVNKCYYTVWPGTVSNGRNAALSTTGFRLRMGESITITAPTSWSGRIWGRTLCSRDSTGNFSCFTGDCGSGEVACSGSAAAPPVTLVELTLGSPDFYDISLVDGYNVPMLVAPQGGADGKCSSSGCVMDLNGTCPSELEVVSSDGKVVACKSACLAFNSPEYCCTGAHNTPETCKPSSYSKIFKSACPSAYSYAYDENMSTFSCASADYDITFCPTRNTSDFQPPKARDCPECEDFNGYCGYNQTTKQMMCFCEDGSIAAQPCYKRSTLPENSRNLKRKLIIGFTSGATGALLLCIIIFYCTMKSLRQKIEFWKTSKVDRNMEAFIRNHGPLALTRYKFADVKKMTNSFKVKLGQGGYGAVYKGKLLNGCLVAVKILKPSKGNGEEFINEVASISRTSHVNVVTLLGFCLEGRKRALIYEFMANGSLEKFISDEANKTTLSLTWENLYLIAIGTARGLEYLHRGCNTRILHFDIKPHNILLDENFCPKISDFGLAKLCPRRESIISISEARGTIGYLAPEVWNRNIGGVSHKSDVYSYGMMLLDMVGGRKNMNTEANCTNEIYFPDWIYDKLEQGNSLEHDGVNAMEENDIAKRMTIVGLWCIQTFPTQRPTISRVIDMLEGSLDSLEMPPKPVMSSPTRIELESSTTTNTMTY